MMLVFHLFENVYTCLSTPQGNTQTCGDVVFRVFNRVVVQLTIDQSNQQHLKLQTKLVEPKVCLLKLEITSKSCTKWLEIIFFPGNLLESICICYSTNIDYCGIIFIPGAMFVDYQDFAGSLGNWFVALKDAALLCYTFV